MNGTGSGIGLRLAATGLFALMSLFVRLASLDAPVGQIVFWRSAVALLPIVLYMLWRREFPSGLRTRRPWGHLKRSLYGCVAMFLSFLSLAYLPLGLATALGFLAPLLTIPVAVVMLKERPGFVVVLASLAGFLGVGLMLVPAFTAPTLATGTVLGVLAGVAMAIVTALAKVQIKALTATEPAGTIAFYFAVVCTVGGALTLPFGWSPATGEALLWLVGAGLAGGFAHIAMTEALARAPASALAPFEYTAMLWALGFDALIFGLAPTPFGLGGACLVVGASAVVAFADRLPFRRMRRMPT